MKRVVIAIVVLCVSFCTISCQERTPSKNFETTLKLNWIFTGSFAGEALGKTDYANDHQLDLDIDPGGQGLDPLKLVGINQFGCAAAGA